MSKSLKREVVKGLKAEGALDMREFGSLRRLKRLRKTIPGTQKSCQTACCLAGHIVAAATRLGLPIPTEKESYARFPSDYGGVPGVARAIWANAYGEKEAKRLGFYGYDGINPTRSWGSLNKVTAEKVVAHVRGEDVTYHPDVF